MERIIPKNSKLSTEIFKGFTLRDMVIIIVMLAIAILILLSDISNKYYLLVGYVLLCVIMFIGEGEERTYNQFVYLAKFIVRRRTYVKGAKHGKTEDLIPFRSIGEDGLIEYNGYFGAIIEIGSIDFGLMDETEQDSRISIFARVLNGLSQSAVIQLIKIDRPIIYDKISARLYEKMLDAREHEERVKETILKSRLNQIDTVNNLMPLYRPTYYIAIFEENLEAIYNQIDSCINSLDSAGLDASLLSAREVAVFFKYCYTRNFNEREIDELDIEELADYVKPDKVKFGLAGYTIDDVYAFTMAVNDYPLYVNNAWGADLFSIDNTKVVLTIRPVEKAKAIKRIDRAVLESVTRKAGKLSEARCRETHVQTMNELQARIQNENEMLFDCTMTVTAFNYTEDGDAAFRKNIRRELTMRGFRTSDLLGRQFDGFLKSTVAGKPKLKTFERGINSDSLAAIFPFVFSSITDIDGYFLGSDYYPVILDMWKRNGEFVNSNGVIFGKSGGGKSFFCKLLLSMVYSDNSRIFVLDPEDEYKKLCKSLDGLFIDVGSATQGRINPLHVYPILTDEGELAPPDVTFNAHLQFLDDFFKLTLKGITQDAFEELNNLVKLMYESVGITPEIDCTKFEPKDFPTFDTLLKTAEKESRLSGITAFRKRNLEVVCTYIKKFASGGMYSTLWNGASTLEVDSRFVVFNFQSLFGAKNKTVANAQMLVVMRFLEMQIINIREQNRSGGELLHPFVVIDEGYNFTDPDYPVALQFIFLEYKRIRKYGGAMIFATQNLNDLYGNSEILAKTTAIVNNSQYSFIFGLSAADLDVLSNVYRNAGGINEAERSYITNADRGDCFAIFSPRKRARFHVEATDVVRGLFDEDFGT